jgi:hypothetical protein
MRRSPFRGEVQGLTCHSFNLSSELRHGILPVTVGEDFMRVTMMMAAVAATAMLAGAAQAQTATDGRYQAALETMITETTQGHCPAEVMGDQLLAACNQQVAAMSAGLQSLGPVVSVTFLGAEDLADGRLERYAVVFSGGQTLNWAIGGEADGKFNNAFVGG